MVLTKEYRICMPITVEEYRIGQLYMIARHSHEQSDQGEGVEVVANAECEDPEHGKGQFTEKRIHLSSRLPYWVQSLIPKIFYVTEKAWNFYPFTITEYTCSFIPKFSISIQTKYENNNGSTENCLNLTEEQMEAREVDFIDIAYDDMNPKHYKETEDPKFYKSAKTGRGPLVEGWRDDQDPIMCSYKLVNARFEVWGLQTKVEDFIQRCIRDILLLGHRQAFAWVDDWVEMTIDDVRVYEEEMHSKTNDKMKAALDAAVDVESSGAATPKTPTLSGSSKGPSTPATPITPKSPSQEAKSWFSWS
ncbi:cytoplasmic phosphatidylinositol transfer protein 1 isoform X2 [Arctopsyche grandis]|uniref:cytoplasmic phosphatidylinositol transfer protein 1 isoform X2 n=1 Tax=Arctopsyche grandis TaxID=121162 RepID=UPI00406D83C9